jgi:hypothetical protein
MQCGTVFLYIVLIFFYLHAFWFNIKSLQFIIKFKIKEGKESFWFGNYFIRDFSTVEAAIIKQNNLKQKISTSLGKIHFLVICKLFKLVS